MPLLELFTFVLCAFFQAPAAPLKEGILDAQEMAQFSRAQKVDDRIQVYAAASLRMERSMTAEIGTNDFSHIPKELDLWVELLSGSLNDIDANIQPKKKPKYLIRYEIQVRKALAVLKEFKVKAPIDQQDIFDSKLTEAEAIRKRFVDIIFR